MLKGLLFWEVPIRVLVPSGIGSRAAAEEMSQLEPTWLLPVFVYCCSTVWADTALCTEDNLLDFLTRCSPGEAVEEVFHLEMCLPAFPAEDTWEEQGIRERNLGAQERDWMSISMSKSGRECWRCLAGGAEGLPSCLLWEVTESIFKPRQLGERGTKISPALVRLICSRCRTARSWSGRIWRLKGEMLWDGLPDE